MARTVRDYQFTDVNGNTLSIWKTRTAVLLDLPDFDPIHQRTFRFRFAFTHEQFLEIYELLTKFAHENWKDFTLKEADSLASDYDEYYDRKLDNNGSISLMKPYGLHVKRPSLESGRLYQFNKAKLQSFLYDYEQLLAVKFN